MRTAAMGFDPLKVFFMGLRQTWLADITFRTFDDFTL